MIEEFELRGEWWLPNNPTTRLSGTLSFSQNRGAVLELDGCFTDDTEEKELFNPPVVNGVSNNGEDITLLHCLGQSLHTYSGGKSTSTLYAHQTFRGVHYKSEVDIKFRSIRIGFSHLDVWLNVSGFNVQKGGKDEEIVVRYKRPDSIVASLNNGLTISIDFGYSYSPYMLTKADITQFSGVTFIPEKDIHFKEFQEIINHFQNFLSLATMKSVYPTSISGATNIEYFRIPETKKVIYKDVDVLYQIVGQHERSEETMGLFFLFSFDSISSQFTPYLQNWFGKAELLKPIHQLYFGSQYSPRMYLDQRFLCYVQALEAYHRRTTVNCELPENEHHKRIEEVLNSVSPKYREWLKQELEYSNEPSLRRRLRELINTHDLVTSRFIHNSKDFINEVCTTRNYFIHYDPSLESKAARGEALHNMTQKLKVLIEACLLKELGFSCEDTRKSLDNHYRRYSFYTSGE